MISMILLCINSFFIQKNLNEKLKEFIFQLRMDFFNS